MTRMLFFLIFSILFSNIIILGKGEDIFENQRKTLYNILLEGDIASVIEYFKIQDSLRSNNLSSNEQNNTLEYKNFRQKYLLLVKRIDFICAKSEMEIKISYSHFLPIQTAFEKRLISNNSVQAFKKFIFFFLNNNYYEAAKFINITFFLNYDEKTLSLNKFKEAYSNFSL